MPYDANNDYKLETFDETIDRVRLAVNAGTGSIYNKSQFEGSNWYRFSTTMTQFAIGVDSNFGTLGNKTLTNLRKLKENFLPAPTPAGVQKDVYDATGCNCAFMVINDISQAGIVRSALDIAENDAEYKTKATKYAEILYNNASFLQYEGTQSIELVKDGNTKIIKFDLMKDLHVQLDYTINVFADVHGFVQTELETEKQIQEEINNSYYAGNGNFTPIMYIPKFPARVGNDTCLLTVAEGGETVEFGRDGISLFKEANYKTNIIVDGITVIYEKLTEGE